MFAPTPPHPQQVKLSSFPALPSRLPCWPRGTCRCYLEGEERQAPVNVRRGEGEVEAGRGGEGREWEEGLLWPSTGHVRDAAPCNCPRSPSMASVTAPTRVLTAPPTGISVLTILEGPIIPEHEGPGWGSLSLSPHSQLPPTSLREEAHHTGQTQRSFLSTLGHACEPRVALACAH